MVCLQEIKSVDEGFPTTEIEALGYNVAVHGQKGFNGVALLSKVPMEDVTRGLPGDDADPQSRYIEALIPAGETRHPLRRPLSAERQSDRHRKIRLQARLDGAARSACPPPARPRGVADPGGRLQRHSRRRRTAKNPQSLVEDALFQPASRAAFRAWSHLGLTDAVRACHPEAGIYTFWDYQAGAFQRDNGIRIDHCCCHRRRPTGSSRAASTLTRGRGKSRPITCRSGSNSTSAELFACAC